MTQIREFERKFPGCSGRRVAVCFECSNNFIRRRTEAAFFAPICLETAGAEQECEFQGDDERGDPAPIEAIDRFNRSS